MRVKASSIQYLNVTLIDLRGKEHPELCRACPENSPKNENLSHILTECLAYADIRERMFP